MGSDKQADSILASHGIAAYEDYLADIQARKEEDRRVEARKLERRERRARRVKGLVGRVWPWRRAARKSHGYGC